MTKEQLDLLRKDGLKGSVDKLLAATNQVTTLEVKNELRTEFPTLHWDQQYVSDEMDELAVEGYLVYTDNGSYRIYTYPVKVDEKLTAKDKKKIKKQIKKEGIRVLLKSLITPYNLGKQNEVINELATILKIKL